MEVSVGLGHDGRPCRALYAVCSRPTLPARPSRSCLPQPERCLEGVSLTEPDGSSGGSPGPARDRAVVRGRVLSIRPAGDVLLGGASGAGSLLLNTKASQEAACSRTLATIVPGRVPELRDAGVSRFVENGSHLAATDFIDEPWAVLWRHTPLHRTESGLLSYGTASPDSSVQKTALWCTRGSS